MLKLYKQTHRQFESETDVSHTEIYVGGIAVRIDHFGGDTYQFILGGQDTDQIIMITDNFRDHIEIMRERTPLVLEGFEGAWDKLWLN